MKCPIDDTQLAITERQGVEIDYCPQCRGVWLDRGELDKIIEKNEGGFDRREPEQSRRHDDDDDRHHYSDRDRDEYHRDHDEYHHKKSHKRESFIGDLFDF